MKRSYTYTPGGQVLYQHNHANPSGSDEFLYVHDRLGSVRLLVDENGSTQNSYTYDPSGLDFATECTENAENPFKFTGQFWDPEISQYYLRARMYDPVLMRFTGRDPILGEQKEPLTLHKYLYATNDPVNRTDPSGKSYIQIANGLRVGTLLYSAGLLVACAGVHHENLDLITLGASIMEISYPVGLAIGMAMGGGPGTTSQITRWGDEIKAGRYVVKGGKNPFNYLRTFKWLPNQFAGYNNAYTAFFLDDMLRIPTGSMSFLDWLFGFYIAP